MPHGDAGRGSGADGRLVSGERTLVAGAAGARRRGRAAGGGMTLLVFGMTGQIERELAWQPTAAPISRAEAALPNPEACATAVRVPWRAYAYSQGRDSVMGSRPAPIDQRAASG